ncbi:MAG: hypothetical protein KDC80_24640 [Saprospiraceae bacterium]|nr:hypothetical protein [Saprospiraceae bacterium]
MTNFARISLLSYLILASLSLGFSQMRNLEVEEDAHISEFLKIDRNMAVGDIDTALNELELVDDFGSIGSPVLRLGVNNTNRDFSGAIIFDEAVEFSQSNSPGNFCGIAIHHDGATNKLKFVGGCNISTSVTSGVEIMSLKREGGVEIHPVSFGSALMVDGDIEATGTLTAMTKNFVHPHPLDPEKEIRYVCLEGPENGTYYRGSSRTQSGSAIVHLPDHFSLLTKDEGITVQVTALGPARIWVAEKTSNQLVIRSDEDVEFDFFVQGLRKGFDDFNPVQENSHFVPDREGPEFAKRFPTGIVKIMQQNGILNQDLSVNIEMARKMQWKLKESRQSDLGSYDEKK